MENQDKPGTIEIIQNKQFELLELLAKYKFLSTSQLLMLGYGKSKNTIRSHIKSMKRETRPFLGEIPGGVSPTLGRQETIYYLAPHGVKLLQDLNPEISNIRHPKSNSVARQNDYFHKKSTINFHILLENWIKQRSFILNFIEFYFDQTGNNRAADKNNTAKAVTNIVIGKDKISNKDIHIIPDANFMINDGTNSHLFLFEMVNGKDTKRVLTQIEKHQIAITEGSPTIKYQHNKGNRVILLFEQEGTKRAIINRTNELRNYKSFSKYFLLKTYEQLENNFFGDWENFDGQKINLF